MRQQEGSGGGGVEQTHHRSPAGRGQRSLAAAVGRGGVSLCVWRGQWASCEASCGKRTEAWAPPPWASLFPAWPCPPRPPPPSLGCWPPGGPRPPKDPWWRSSAELGGPRSASLDRLSGPGPSRTLAPIWLPHWPACRCTISRMAAALMVDAAALVLLLGTAAAAKHGLCDPGAPLYERAGLASLQVTGPLRPPVPPRDGGCWDGRIPLPCRLETSGGRGWGEPRLRAPPIPGRGG